MNTISRSAYAIVLSIVVMLALSAAPFAFAAEEDWGDFGGGGGFDYYDTFTPGGYDYYDTYTPSQYDYYDTYTPGAYDYYDTYTPGSAGYDYYDTYTPGDSYAPEYSYNDYCGCYEDSYGYSADYSSGFSYSQPYYQQAMSFVPPAVRQYVPSQPIYSQPQRPIQQQQQQQQQQQGGSTPININNVNTNVNTNTNVAPTPAQPQTIIQYVPQYQPVYQPTYQQAPYCTITATTNYNGMVTLSWSSTNATTAYISPNVGSVAPYGTTNLYAYGTRIYTMTVTGPGGTQTCTTQALVTPTTPYVSLSQIPYTGFDLGPIGNAMYWAALLSFAVAGAYLLVYYKGGAMALVSSTLARKTPVMQTVAQAPIQASTPVAASVEEASLVSLPTMMENTTRDTMKIARAANGMPSIVIARA